MATVQTWFGFILSLVAILLISRKSLPLGLICGAIVLGVFTLPGLEVLGYFKNTLLDPSILYLSLAMGIIPIIGGSMKTSGQIDDLVNNIRIRQRFLLPVSAALMGLLPMPGGALLSAPILEQGGAGVPNDLKAAINNWYRHLFILIYPLSPALIVAAEISSLDVYVCILYLLPAFALAALLGYAFFLRKIHGRIDYRGIFSARSLLRPLAVIVSAPVLDFALKRLFGIDNLATVIAVAVSLGLSLILSGRVSGFFAMARAARPWNFALIIIGMFFYLHVFQASDARFLIAQLPLTPIMLSLVSGFVLALATGRVQLPVSIVIPVYLATVTQISPIMFALIYSATYFGYIISPVHPCLVVTCEYFQIPIRQMIAKLAMPTLIVVLAAIITAIF